MEKWSISNDNGSTCRINNEETVIAIVFCEKSLARARLIVQAPRMKELLEKVARGDSDGVVQDARIILNLIGENYE